MTENTDILRSIEDLREIRRAVDRASGRSKLPQIRSLKTHLSIQLLAAALFGGIALLDLFVRPSPTDFLILTFAAEPWRFVFIFLLLGALITVSSVVYLIVWQAARTANEPISGYIARNFSYLSLATFSSDLFIKFAALTVTILARRPDWVPALLIACTGDYLIQGRGFVLPVRVGLIWGALYHLLAVCVLLFVEGDLWQACIALILPALASAVHIRRMQKRAATEVE